MRRLLPLLLCVTGTAQAARLKELADIEGFRDNALVGYGLVVGLQGTGDDSTSAITRRSLAALMKHLGVQVDPIEVKAKNVATVIVTAKLPPFAHSGTDIDVTVSSMGTAKSLQGGTLIATPLKGADLETYAIAQGSLSLGGFAFEGASGSSTKKNHVTAGNIPGGATIERDSPGEMPRKAVVLHLRTPDFTTATRIATAIDAVLGAGSADVADPATVAVAVSGAWKGRVPALIAALEPIEVEPDVVAKVVIDERTGTIVVGANVTLGPAAIAHGGLIVKVTETPAASQPNPLSKGKTVVVPATDIKVDEEAGRLEMVQGGSTVADVAAALNALGVKPRDLPPIFRALKAAGALRAEIEVI
jgi:flagellar P-ring protein precursor FlgI